MKNRPLQNIDLPPPPPRLNKPTSRFCFCFCKPSERKAPNDKKTRLRHFKVESPHSQSLHPHCNPPKKSTRTWAKNPYQKQQPKSETEFGSGKNESIPLCQGLSRMDLLRRGYLDPRPYVLVRHIALPAITASPMMMILRHRKERENNKTSDRISCRRGCKYSKATQKPQNRGFRASEDWWTFIQRIARIFLTNLEKHVWTLWSGVAGYVILLNTLYVIIFFWWPSNTRVFLEQFVM